MDKFTIADVARIHGLQEIKSNGTETYCHCPFCGDRRGKFSYIVEKGSKRNMYHCFKCDEQGSAIDLHIKLSPLTDYSGDDGYKKAVRDIFSAINGDEIIAALHRKDQDKPKTKEAQKTSDVIISKVYYALLSELELREEHKKDLLKRGLSETDIKRFRFKSTPKNPKAICKTLVNKGYNLEGVPGFYMENGAWTLRIVNQGYLCPVYDGAYNYIIGFQIRVDKPFNGAKYLWVSSAGKEKGTSPGALTTYLPGKNANVCIITEGILKAIIVYSLLKGEVTVMGIPGTNSYKSSSSYFQRMNSFGFVFEAYDMDKLMNAKTEEEKKKTTTINDCAKNMRSLVEDYNLGVHPLIWDYDEKKLWKGNFKGLDDFLLEYDSRDKFIAYLLKTAEKPLKLQKYFQGIKKSE